MILSGEMRIRFHSASVLVGCVTLCGGDDATVVPGVFEFMNLHCPVISLLFSQCPNFHPRSLLCTEGQPSLTGGIRGWDLGND